MGTLIVRGFYMKVLSINVSLPKEVDWQGRRVLTSIFKEPVAGRRRVARLNIDGDGQSDLMAHGGEHRAVFVYQKESYEYWSTVLGRSDLHYGQFGENLTVEGLADAEVCIGDRYQIGTVVFEVTQPRVTCYKVALSTGVREMPSLLVSHKRPGFYFRVIVEGEIGVGDEIVKVAGGNGQMTVAEVDGLLYSNAHPADRLRVALDVGVLSAGWRGSLQALYDAAVSGVVSGNAGLEPSAIVVAWQGFRRFVVDAVSVESAGVLAFTLRSADGGDLPAYVAGQHIVVRIPDGGVGAVRMYSLCGPVGGKYYRIAVKEEVDGVGSGYLHRLVVGGVLEVSAPRGGFMLVSGDRPLVLMGAGIGITPLLAMLYAAAKDRVVWWVYTTQDKEHYPFRAEVRRLSEGLGHFFEYTLFTRPQPGDVVGLDYNGAGRPTLEGLRQLGLPVDGDYYLCGPSGFMAGCRAALLSLGVAEAAIRQEAFGADGSAGVRGLRMWLAAGVGRWSCSLKAGSVVRGIRGGVRCWRRRRPVMCRSAGRAGWGFVIVVRRRCSRGETEYVTPPLDRPAGGNILICCSVPRSEIQLDL
ncbi:MOSC domain-containing protein [Puia sp. P3]|uniref:MOSC domain-containing protein n=1 Tax=Puia sp. P3 TaxID=3423952 RepID=UPI003D679F42